MEKPKSDPYKTILVIYLGLSICYIIWRIEWLIMIGLTVSSISLISIKIANKFEVIWFKLSEILGLFIPNVILTIFYFFILFPFSLLSKIFSRSKNNFHKKKGINTNYVLVKKSFKADDFDNPW